MKLITVHNSEKTIDVLFENEKIDLQATYDNKYCMTNLRVNSNGHTSRELFALLNTITNKVKSLKPFN